MVQEFQVLRCFSCQTFQVHQVRKSQKWACKLCGEKQSLLKVYGRGSGADCRRHVQKLNLLQGEVGQAASCPDERNVQNAISDSDNCDDTQGGMGASQEASAVSRWNKYLEENRDSACEEGESLSDAGQDVLLSREENPSTIRKRKTSLQYGCGFESPHGEGVDANRSKKNRICENSGVSAPGASQPYSRRTEDIGSSKCRGKPVSHTLPVVVQSCTESRWERFLPSKEPEEEHISSTPSFQNREPEVDIDLNQTPPYKKAGQGWLSAIEQGNQPIGPDMLPGHPLADHQTDHSPKAGASSSLPKPLTLFHTDDDFDDDY
ncbi:MRN complex-interacting protein isoform X2 [Pseudophryne corroboree]|uniref:MRN complex-interacting protein isoform X2 n=1 Tax=Pseudophryne corroboree TaxID=495146 RepID=UPI003081A989